MMEWTSVVMTMETISVCHCGRIAPVALLTIKRIRNQEVAVREKLHLVAFVTNTPVMTEWTSVVMTMEIISVCHCGRIAPVVEH